MLEYIIFNSPEKSDNELILKKKKSKRSNLPKNKALTSLELKMGNLLNQLKEDKITNMNMESSNITDLEIRALGPLLSSAQNLKKISFKQNKITDRGVKYLCDILNNSNIEILDLSSNRISLKSFQKFKELKMQNPKLKCIVLRNNDISVGIKKKRRLEFQKIGLMFDL